MTLVEKYDLLNQKQVELTETKSLASAKAAKLKALSIDDDQYEELKKEAQEVLDKVTELTNSINTLNTEIEEEEKQLEDAVKKHSEHQKKGNQSMNYLSTKQSALAFVQILLDNEGRSSKSIANEWQDHLASKGVTDIDKVLPEPVLLAIQNAFVDYTGVLNHVSTDPRYAARIVLQTVSNAAKGQQSGKVKKDMEVSYTDFTINSATVYIKHALDYADLKKDTTGNYFNHVMKELAAGFIRAVERAVVIGDGLDARNQDKITEIKSIAEETLTELFDTQEINTAAATFGTEQLEALVAGLDKLAETTTPILVTSKAVARKLKLAKDADGKYLDPNPFAPIATTGNVISGFTVYVYDWMNGANNPIIAFADKAYTLVGDEVAADRFDDYDVTINRRNIELASVMGGRLSKFKSAIKFTNTPG
ncbi:TPA: phage major capsid protein [Streptococcus suis]